MKICYLPMTLKENKVWRSMWFLKLVLKEKEVQECDATMINRNSVAGNQKIFLVP
jgi:hypothetical protein